MLSTENMVRANWLALMQFVKHMPLAAAYRALAVLVLWILALAGAAPPCAAQPKPNQAGDIRALIPVGYVVRANAPAVPAQRNDPLYWQDVVRTERGGRVRIGLLDGSILNVGSESSLAITKHDPAVQETQVDLIYGRIRAKAVRIMQPGGSFKVRTPVAVTGVVGTRFYIVTTADMTFVLCLEDTVRVRNAEDRVTGEVVLHAGEFTRVLRGMPPAAASPASPEQLRESEDTTSVAPGPIDYSRVEISWPPPGCGQEITLLVRAWSKETQNGKEIETQADSELVDGKLMLGGTPVNVEGGRAVLASAPAIEAPSATFLPEGKQAPVPAKVWPALKLAEGQGWRAPRAVFTGNSFYVLGPIGLAHQVAFTFNSQPATVLWVGPCGMGLLAPMNPGGTYQVAVYVSGRTVANGEMNLVQISYDVPRPPALMRGQTTQIGIELRGLAGLDQFTQGRPVEVTMLTNDTPAVLGELRSKTPGANAAGEVITYRVGAHNLDGSGVARLEATGRGRQRGSFNLSVKNELDEALERPTHPLTPVEPKP